MACRSHRSTVGRSTPRRCRVCGGRVQREEATRVGAAPLARKGAPVRSGALTTGGRGTRPSGCGEASAVGAGSPRSVACGISSPPFAAQCSGIGAERVERPSRGLQPRMLPLHHAPFPSGRKRERVRSIRPEARHGPIRFLRGDRGHGAPPVPAELFQRVWTDIQQERRMATHESRKNDRFGPLNRDPAPRGNGDFILRWDIRAARRGAWEGNPANLAER